MLVSRNVSLHFSYFIITFANGFFLTQPIFLKGYFIDCYRVCFYVCLTHFYTLKLYICYILMFGIS